MCGLIGHKKLICPNPPQPFPHVKYSIPLQASSSSESGPRLVFSPAQRDDSDSGRISSEGPGPAHSSTEANSSSSSSHGGESTHLQQLVTRFEMARHVAAPPSTERDVSFSNTRVPAQPFSQRAAPLLPRLQSLEISPHIWPLKWMPASPAHFLHWAARIQPRRIPHLLRQIFQLAITNLPPLPNIQEISDNPALTHPAHFTDFLSSWAQTKPANVICLSSGGIFEQLVETNSSIQQSICRVTII